MDFKHFFFLVSIIYLEREKGMGTAKYIVTALTGVNNGEWRVGGGGEGVDLEEEGDEDEGAICLSHFFVGYCIYL